MMYGWLRLVMKSISRRIRAKSCGFSMRDFLIVLIATCSFFRLSNASFTFPYVPLPKVCLNSKRLCRVSRCCTLTPLVPVLLPPLPVCSCDDGGVVAESPKLFRLPKLDQFEWRARGRALPLVPPLANLWNSIRWDEGPTEQDEEKSKENWTIECTGRVINETFNYLCAYI